MRILLTLPTLVGISSLSHLFNETQRPKQRPRWWLSTLGLMDPQVPSHTGIVTLRGQMGTPVMVLTTGPVLFMAPLAPGKQVMLRAGTSAPGLSLQLFQNLPAGSVPISTRSSSPVSAQAPESLWTPSTAEAQALDGSPCLEQPLGWGNGM